MRICAPCISLADLCRVLPGDPLAQEIAGRDGETILVYPDDELRLRWQMAVTNGLMLAMATAARQLVEAGRLDPKNLTAAIPLVLGMKIDITDVTLSLSWDERPAVYALWAQPANGSPYFCGLAAPDGFPDFFYVSEWIATRLYDTNAPPIALLVTKRPATGRADEYADEDVAYRASSFTVSPPDEDGPSRVILTLLERVKIYED